MNTRTWPAILLIIILAALVGGGYYYSKKITPRQTELIELKKIPLNTAAAPTLAPATQKIAPPQIPTTASKKTYTGDVFSFQYPSDWVSEQDNAMGERHATFKKNGVQVAKLDCPIPAVGFENIKTTSTSNLITKGGGDPMIKETGATKVNAVLNLTYGSASDPAEKDELIMVTMTKETDKLDEQQGQYGTSCMLSAQKLALLDIFKDIYESITLN